MEIRNMQIEDYEEVYALWRATPGMGLNDIDDSKEGIAKYLKRNPDTSFVAIANNEIIGTILAGHDGRRGYISHTAVAVLHRKKGIGTALADACLAAMEKEGIAKVALVVFAHNETGNAFWEKQGFTLRENICYRNKTLQPMVRIDT
ncbi:MAG: GNAT family N-acetyltransferase [Christensenellaceae bacterium]